MPAKSIEEKIQRIQQSENYKKNEHKKKLKLHTIRTEFPGALLATLMWIIFSRLYGTYMSHQIAHPTIYGSLTGFFLTLLWLYYCTIFTFIGAMFNTYYYETGETATSHILKDIPDFIRITWAKLPFNKNKQDKSL